MRKPDPLAEYNARRDFAKTREPPGRSAVGKTGNRFLVQKHDATRLHWDLRLEVDGVLKSWAVTKGPSHDPAHKRLAVRTEDHPLAYADFEATIARSEYGGGTVMLWDEGSWRPVAGKSAADLEDGHLHFVLSGKRMQGEWILVRLKPRGKEKRENWLLRKVADEFAGTGDALVERALTSVRSGRTMQEIADGKAGSARKKAGRKSLRPPRFEPVQLATLTDAVPAGPEWMHEIKYDGYRALLAVGGGDARIYTRSGLDWTDRFPAIATAAAALPVASALIDGEIVVLGKNGNPDFAALQQALAEGQGRFEYFAFDLLQLDGDKLKSLPNVERKARLHALIPAKGALRYSDHIIGDGEPLFAAMCKAGGEGVVSKRVDARYQGRRTQTWLKVKCTRRQEFVIIGWTSSRARGRKLAALLLGVHRDGALTYAGKVGTGFTAETIDQLIEKLEQLRIDAPPAAVPSSARRGANWARPALVAEVTFANITADGVLRHASFIALREDKPAATITFDRAMTPAAPADVPISNADRVIFPDNSVTKGDLADYYNRVAGELLAFAAHRPFSLLRCPDGIGAECFFQRHGAKALGEAVYAVPVRGKDGKSRDYFYIDDRQGLLECVQMGAIEFHGWGSLAHDLERPDRLVIDLDPDEGLEFVAVRRAARSIRKTLADLGLVSFPMLSGGKGLHIIIPIRPEHAWPVVTDFAHRFALALAEQSPDKYVATMAKVKRKGRIFIDWLRNQRGSTAILPYSARARKGAPVAAPVSWDELDDVDAGNHFGLGDAGRLLARARSSDLDGWGRADQSLPDV